MPRLPDRFVYRLPVIIWSCLTAFSMPARADEPLHQRSVVRRPVAIVSATDSRLLVANRETGTISLLNAQSAPSITGEFPIARQLDDLVAIPNASGRFLGVDSSEHQVISLTLNDRPLVTSRQTVSGDPVSLVVSADGDVVSVASLWSRRITLLATDSLSVLTEIDIPFAPLKQVFLDDEHVLAIDAFGGRMAVIDVPHRRVQSHLSLNGQNIRGLAVAENRDGRRDVLLTHQILNVASSTTRSIISWGGVLSNTLHSIAIDEFLESQSLDPDHPDRIHGRLFPLGTQGRGAGDPGDVTSDGESIWVALSGVNEVAVRRGSQQSLIRQQVPRRPTKLLRHGDAIAVVCTSDDSISFLDPSTLETNSVLPLGPPVERTLRQSGEELFFDARLSLDGWYSCHSCHADGHTIGRLNDNFGDETFNTPKRILTLLGVGATRPWAWNGSQTNLRDQVRKSIELTMAGPGKTAPELTPQSIEAIVAYISALPPAPGVLAARGKTDHSRVTRGRVVFNKHGCSNCHRPPTYTSPMTHDVGIKDEWGLTAFSPPSLRGVSQRESYFHDNRARRLIDVFREHDHDGTSSLPDQELSDLVLFLKTL